MNTLMSNTKFSLRKIKEITTDPKVLYTKANVFKKLGKTDEYIELLTQAAINNYSKAQYTLAQAYLEQCNLEECEEWYKLAFKNGVEVADYDLGKMYYNLKVTHKRH